MNESIKAIDIEKTKVLSFSKIRKNTYLFTKRLFDIICSIIGLILLIPVTWIVKICYVLTGDFKTVFYAQKRIGKDGKIIYLYKFRTMVPNAGEVLKELLKDPKYKKEWDENQKFHSDPRITKIGKLLRKSSLDELPQFVNVFKGEMSLIGPRPLVIGELDAHNGNHEIYESVRPGITGWWACSGRSNTDYDERLKLEYYYVHNQSLLLDIKCVFKTIGAVLFSKGAK